MDASAIVVRARDIRPGDVLGGTRHRTARLVVLVEHDKARGVAKLFTEGGCQWVPLDQPVDLDRRAHYLLTGRAS